MKFNRANTSIALSSASTVGKKPRKATKTIKPSLISKPADTVNLAGGAAYSESKKLELVSILLTSFVSDQFYRSAGSTIDRLRAVMSEVNDPLFVAKAALFARNEYGMRSISHVAAAWIAQNVHGKSWLKSFFCNIVRRPDDALEICALLIDSEGKVKLSNAAKKGFALALSKFDAYQLSKYTCSNGTVKLVDLVNLVHPTTEAKATVSSQEYFDYCLSTKKCKRFGVSRKILSKATVEIDAFRALTMGLLKNNTTTSRALTRIGQNVEGEENQLEARKEFWVESIKNRSIGYLDLVRSLTKICKDAPEVIDDVCDILVNANMIRRSLTMPLTLHLALKMTDNAQLGRALNKALELSCSNVPKLPGKTLVVIDVSGSMGISALGPNGNKNSSCSEIAKLMGAILAKAVNADVMVFADRAAIVKVNTLDSIQTMVDSMKASVGGGTNFHSIFEYLNKNNAKYDRIAIFSDCQGWVDRHPISSVWNPYVQMVGHKVFLYSFDLHGYGTLMFPQENVFACAGYSDKIFSAMQTMETEKATLVSQIESVSL